MRGYTLIEVLVVLGITLFLLLAVGMEVMEVRSQLVRTGVLR